MGFVACHAADSAPPGYRHELKYLINLPQMRVLENQLPDLMMPDPHAGTDGKYQIRSLYFDDYEDSCYFDNENGNDPREKFRIRIYNGSADRISLELKRKEAEMTYKRSCVLTKDMAERMIHGEPIPWEDSMDPLLKKFYILQETRFLQPKIIVEYDRVPYIYPDGNVRVTLDLDVRASVFPEDFFRRDIAVQPIMPSGAYLLEVKYDQLLPDFLYRTLQRNHLPQTTFSKYYYCRKFGDLL